MATYVISDIHGCYDEFMRMLELIKFSPSDKLIIVGDMVDRGPDSIKLVEFVMKQSNIDSILGNHEDMMLGSLINNNQQMINCWLNNGGHITLQELESLRNSRPHYISKILTYLQTLPLYIIHDKYIIVHGGVDIIVDPKYNSHFTVEQFMSAQDRNCLLWIDGTQINTANMPADYTLIVGHTPTIRIKNQPQPFRIVKRNKIIYIDCGSVFKGGQLGCLCLDTMEEFYIEKR